MIGLPASDRFSDLDSSTGVVSYSQARTPSEASRVSLKASRLLATPVQTCTKMSFSIVHAAQATAAFCVLAVVIGKAF